MYNEGLYTAFIGGKRRRRSSSLKNPDSQASERPRYHLPSPLRHLTSPLSISPYASVTETSEVVNMWRMRRQMPRNIFLSSIPESAIPVPGGFMIIHSESEPEEPLPQEMDIKSTASPAEQIHIGLIPLTTHRHSSDCVIMPYRSECRYASTTTTQSAEKQNTIYLVFQHSKSAGYSKLLLYSNAARIFQSHDEAHRFLRELKDKRRPLVKRQGESTDEDEGAPKFWCTADDSDDETDGFEFTSENGEEYVVWIEEHECSQAGSENGELQASKTW